MVRIIVNGSAVELEPDTTLQGWLDAHPPAHRAYAIEVNKTLIPRRDHAGYTLRDGDVVEIVTLVGGG